MGAHRGWSVWGWFIRLSVGVFCRKSQLTSDSIGFVVGNALSTHSPFASLVLYSMWIVRFPICICRMCYNRKIVPSPGACWLLKPTAALQILLQPCFIWLCGWENLIELQLQHFDLQWNFAVGQATTAHSLPLSTFHPNYPPRISWPPLQTAK